MLLSLGEDCLVHLSKFLSVEDQIALSRVCTFLKEFFEENFWKWQCKTICLTRPFWNKIENKFYLPTFLQSAATSVEKLEFGKEHLAIYGHLLIKLKFPKMRSLVAYLHDYQLHDYQLHDYQLHDGQLLEISQVFPNIKELHLKGTFKGQHIPLFVKLEKLNLEPFSNYISKNHFLRIYNLPNLKKITLISSRKTSAEYLEAIQLAQHCSTLEEIVLNEDIFYEGIMNNLKKIKNLRILTVQTRESFHNVSSILKNIEKHFGEAIDTLVFHKIYLESAKMLTIKSLRRIMFCEVYIEMEELELLCCNLPNNLEEFIWNSKQGEKMEAGIFLRMIHNCHNLRLLDLSGSTINKNFIEDIVAAADFQDHEQPLILRCFQTKTSAKDLKDLELPANLQVTCLRDDFCLDVADDECFQVQLNRTKIKKEDVEENTKVYAIPFLRRFYYDYDYQTSARDCCYDSDYGFDSD